MATLERIRRRSGLLITIIGIAMMAFILTDLLGNGNSMFRGDANVIGKIDGKSIDANEFSREMADYERRLQEQQAQNPQQQVPPNYTRKQIADGVWDQMLREIIMGKQYEGLGIFVTDKEVYERIKLNPNVQGAPVFQDQQTGQFSEALFQQYVNNMRENQSEDNAVDALKQWIDFEDGTRTDTKVRKYTAAIEKGLYVPKTMARMEYLLNNTSSTSKFMVLEYTSIADSTVNVTEADLKKYYNSHKEDYKSDEKRSLEFVRFDIQPSPADHADVTGALSALLKDQVLRGDTVRAFAEVEDDSAFAANYSDLGVTPIFYRKSNIPAPLDSTLMDQEIGYVQGPYLDGDSYRLTKVRDMRNLPDSVEARHILISFAEAASGKGNPDRPFQQAKVLVDSLLEVIKGDTAQFAELAKTNSDDPGSGAKGGKLDWFNDRTMVKPFSDFAFQGKVGNIKLVLSQFGFHIIEILNQGGSTKAIELITISRELSASNETYDIVYNEASAFASSIKSIEEFTPKATEGGYAPRPVTGLLPFDESVPGIGSNRELVKWVYNEDTKLGDVQLMSNNNDSYVVAILIDVESDGYTAFEKVEDQIRPLIIKEKKAELLAKKIKDAMTSGSDINAMATALNVQVKDQVSSLGGTQLSGYGREPEVIGAMSAVELNTLSEPVAGERGVFVVITSTRSEATDLPDYSIERDRLQQGVRPRVAGQLFPSLKETAKIKDKRAVFY